MRLPLWDGEDQRAVRGPARRDGTAGVTPIARRLGGSTPAVRGGRSRDRLRVHAEGDRVFGSDFDHETAVPKGRYLILSIVAVGLAALFVRLGMWQLSRHDARAAGVASRVERGAEPPLVWATADDVAQDTSGLIGRRARLVGEWDLEREVILRSRTMGGRAGAELLTPLVIDGTEVVMVLRGWLPAPDGLRPDVRAGFASATGPADVSGVLISSGNGRGGQPLWVSTSEGERLALAGIDLDQIRGELGFEVSPHVLRADDPAPGTSTLGPARALETDLGSHFSYAIQWFSFAVIAIVGTAILIRKERFRGPQEVR